MKNFVNLSSAELVQRMVMVTKTTEKKKQNKKKYNTIKLHLCSPSNPTELLFCLQKLLKLNTTESVSTNAHLFSVESGLLPSYIPVRVANKILFVGESIQMFQDQGKTATRKKGTHKKCSLEPCTLSKAYLSCNVRYHNFEHVRPPKTETSLHICQV